MKRIESFLSARLFLVPQLVGDRLYFISNLNGRNSLYVMDRGGSVPEPLLPPDIALQNPHLIDGLSFVVLPKLEKILVMIDQDGDENYQPMFIPLTGGYPEPFHPDVFAGNSIIAGGEDLALNKIFLISQSRTESIFHTYLADLTTGELTLIYATQFGGFPAGVNKDYSQFVLAEGYGAGDIVLFHHQLGQEAPTTLYGTPIAERRPGVWYPPITSIPATSITTIRFVAHDLAFSDTYGLAFILADSKHAACGNHLRVTPSRASVN
ncbi:MAG: hypothetical protein H6656_10300 [Ardenticatenaceae bacterium]|nr:hypothetical protein [Ardenticatenaceae bacterium]